MMNLKTQNICSGVNFNSIYLDKFKTGRISATFFLPLVDDETASRNALLAFMLKRRCAKYPSFLKLNQKLAELYGASLRVQVFKLGDAQAFTISINGIEDRFSFEKDAISQKLTQLLCDILLDPFLAENDHFSKEDLELEKQQLIGRIDSECSNKRVYAKNRCEQLMCKNEPYSISKYGTREAIEKITVCDIKESWQMALKSARIELMQISSSNPDISAEVFKKAFSKISRKDIIKIDTKIIKEAVKESEYEDLMDVTQAKLVMGFRCSMEKHEAMIFKLMCAVFGGTPSSKLFMNVREKMSLCYYCSAGFNKNKSIMLVQSAVEMANLKKAKDEILHQLDLMKRGEITDDEINAAKLSLSNGLRTTTDHLEVTESLYLSQMFDNSFQSPEEMVNELNLVTKEDIIHASNNITLDTVYILKGAYGG